MGEARVWITETSQGAAFCVMVLAGDWGGDHEMPWSYLGSLQG